MTSLAMIAPRIVPEPRGHGGRNAPARHAQARQPRTAKGSADAHNEAFVNARFPERVRKQIEGDGLATSQLETIARRSATEDLYLVCARGLGRPAAGAF